MSLDTWLKPREEWTPTTFANLFSHSIVALGCERGKYQVA